MRKQIAPALIAILIALCLTACAQESPPPPTATGTEAQGSNGPAGPPITPEQASALVAGNTAFALELYGQRAGGSQDNLVFSPHSISLALAMTYAGAQGETETQMAEALHFRLPQGELHPAMAALNQAVTTLPEHVDDDAFRINIANSVWGRKDHPFRDEYLQTLKDSYGDEVRETDFQEKPEESRVRINDWVTNETEERIKDLLPPGEIKPDTALVLANAIYVDAEWLHPFERSDTRMRPFFLLDGTEVQVPSMTQGEELAYVQGEDYQVVELPYRGGSAAMTIVVPDQGKFAQVEEALDEALLTEVTSGAEVKLVRLTLPKFEMEHSIELPQTLSEMGMPRAFSKSDADFRGIDGRSCARGDQQCLYVSQAFHKAFIKVDEEGTEAAAATGVIARPVSGPPTPDVTLNIDRPFIFVIRHLASGAVLFMGRVTEPEPPR